MNLMSIHWSIDDQLVYETIVYKASAALPDGRTMEVQSVGNLTGSGFFLKSMSVGSTRGQVVNTVWGAIKRLDHWNGTDADLCMRLGMIPAFGYREGTFLRRRHRGGPAGDGWVKKASDDFQISLDDGTSVYHGVLHKEKWRFDDWVHLTNEVKRLARRG